jgi:hypothetical protein
MPINNLQIGSRLIHSLPGKCLTSDCRKTPESIYWQIEWPCLHRSGPHCLIKHSPHALITSCDDISAILSSSCTKQAAYLGSHTTSCTKTSENVCPAVFGRLYRRNDKAFRAECLPHAYWHIKYLLAIFKHAFTQCAHNRVCNLSSSVKVPEGNPTDKCQAYTEVISLTW